MQPATEKFIFAQPIGAKKPSEQARRVAHEIKRSSTAAKASAFGEVNETEDGLEIARPRQLENDVDENPVESSPKEKPQPKKTLVKDNAPSSSGGFGNVWAK